MSFRIEVLHERARSVRAVMREEYGKAESAVQTGIARATGSLQADWRADVGRALGRRLERSIRKKVFPERGRSINAAGLVWTRAPVIIDAHERGAVIRARGGLWLAIPTEEAGRGRSILRDQRTGSFAGMTPARWQAATGIRLRFVARPGRHALLVADDARISKRGIAVQNRRRARRDGIRTGSMTVPIFILIRQVSLPKRLNLEPLARANLNKVPAFITQSWPR